MSESLYVVMCCDFRSFKFNLHNRSFQELKHSLMSQNNSSTRYRLEEASRTISKESTDHNKLRELIALGIGFHHAGVNNFICFSLLRVFVLYFLSK